jgi:hypothetical protein
VLSPEIHTIKERLHHCMLFERRRYERRLRQFLRQLPANGALSPELNTQWLSLASAIEASAQSAEARQRLLPAVTFPYIGQT